MGIFQPFYPVNWHFWSLFPQFSVKMTLDSLCSARTSALASIVCYQIGLSIAAHTQKCMRREEPFEASILIFRMQLATSTCMLSQWNSLFSMAGLRKRNFVQQQQIEQQQLTIILSWAGTPSQIPLPPTFGAPQSHMASHPFNLQHSNMVSFLH